jgi:hypothetical protein
MISSHVEGDTPDTEPVGLLPVDFFCRAVQIRSGLDSVTNHRANRSPTEPFDPALTSGFYSGDWS